MRRVIKLLAKIQGEIIIQNNSDSKNNVQKIRSLPDCAEIHLPLFDQHADQITLYAEKTDNGFLVSDDGYAINELLGSGITLTDEHKKAIEQLCHVNGIIRNKNEFVFRTGKSDLEKAAYRFGKIILQIVEHRF